MRNLLQFSTIKTDDIEAQLDKQLKQNREKIKALLSKKTVRTWQNLILPLEELENNLHHLWAPVNHVNNVANTPELRQVYNRCLPKLSKYHTDLGHNTQLYQAIHSIQKDRPLKKLTPPQEKVLEDECRDFKLAGVHLKGKQKKQFSQLQQRHTELMNKFAENVLDVTHAWTYHTTNKNKLKGMPDYILTTAEETAKSKNLSGWILTLDFPIYYATLCYADSRSLREKIYQAYAIRASELDLANKQYDNSPVMNELLKIRLELANLLGFQNYAEYSLATKMADTSKEVLSLLYQLASYAKPIAEKEYKELKSFAQNQFNIRRLYAWDIAYYSEKLRQHQFSLSQEALRPYFPEAHVLKGLFKLTEKLFGIKIKETKNKDTWHADVKTFKLYDSKKTLRGFLYVDLYARINKRGGAWMDDGQCRWKLKNNKIQPPIAFLTCNFNKPAKNNPSLLTHDEVITLFHEFGHCLHHLLTTVDYPEISGTNGVEWDAVELPSQLMEHFCWNEKILRFISCHHKTGKPLSHKVFLRLIKSKNFQTGLKTIRQLIFALFDFDLHLNFNRAHDYSIQNTLNQIRENLEVYKTPSFNRFQNTFSHIFAGSYAAGYYSYLWAEVLACDAFSKFEEHGVLDKKTGQEFLKNILEKGGSEKAMQLFMKFRGRKPTLEALLKYTGLI